MKQKADSSSFSFIIDEQLLAKNSKDLLARQDKELALTFRQEELSVVEVEKEELDKHLIFLESSFKLFSNNKEVSETFAHRAQNNLLEVDTPHDGSCLFYSIILSFLLPVLNDEAQFNEQFVCLFGEETQITTEQIKRILTDYDGCLTSLEDSKLYSCKQRKVHKIFC
jgi:hypothetical protein